MSIKQLQRTVIPNRWRAARAPFHYARASRASHGSAWPLSCGGVAREGRALS